MAPDVSIIVPVYNAEPFMHRCITSIQAQTLRDVEIILVDDGSTDNSGDIADSYAAGDARIQVIHQANCGAGAARNQGIRAACGRYIGFVDADDWVEPEMYADMVAVADRCDAEITICNYIEKNKAYASFSVGTHPLPPEEVQERAEIVGRIINTFATSPHYGYFSCLNKIYRRDWLLKKQLTMDETCDIGEDLRFNLEAFTQSQRVVGVKGVYYHYRRVNSRSITKNYRDDRLFILNDNRKRILAVMERFYLEVTGNELDTQFFHEAMSCAIGELRTRRTWGEVWRRIDTILSHEDVRNAAKYGGPFPRHIALLASAINGGHSTTAKAIIALWYLWNRVISRNKVPE